MQQAFRSKTMPIASYRTYDKKNDDVDRNVLKDLTGNGHDIQLYNFAFAENSGYGKYGINFNECKYNENNGGQFSNKSNYKFTITKIISSNVSLLYSYIHLANCFKNGAKIKVSGIKQGENISYVNISNPSYEGYKKIIIEEDGEYILPSSIYTDSVLWAGISSYTFVGDCNITIELIPDYQGALVSDGVDDYGLCENFPILTKEKGYTVCAIRAIINITNLGSLLGNGTNYTNGSFLFEYYVKNETMNRIRTISFGNVTELEPQPSRNISFIYQTKDKYNGKAIYVGNTSQSEDILALFRPFENGNSSSIVLYALEIYDRDLTDEEIAKVKARMIAEYEEKTGNKYEEETV